VAEHRGDGELTSLVSQAWDLPAIEQRYEAFCAEFGSEATPDPLTSLIELVHAWRRFPSLDPGLPPSLLPPRWSGTRAAEVFAARHAAWSAAAVDQWTSLSQSAS
jgi:phenylacetic acid degradation operon negative regulatory protein